MDKAVFDRWWKEGVFAERKLEAKGSCKKEDYDHVIHCFTECIKQNDCSGACLHRGNAYFAQKKYDKAIADYTKQISSVLQFNLLFGFREQDVADYYLLRGDAYAKKKERKKAFHDYNKTIEGYSYLIDKVTKGEWKELAKKYFCQRDVHWLYLRRGKVHDRKKEYDKAIADYSRAMKVYPEDPSSCFERGKVYFKKREYDKAIAEYIKIIETKGGSTEVEDIYLCLGDAYSQKGECDKAIAAYIKGAEDFCSSGWLYSCMGGLPYKESKEYEKVQECIRKAKSLGGKISKRFLKHLHAPNGVGYSGG